MPTRPEPINAILYAQWHLKGGFRNTLAAMGLVALCIAVAFGIALSSNPNDKVNVAKGSTFILLGLQWLLLGLYGTSRVAAAVRTDLAGGLIESHRITPNSPLAAAIGYLVGAPIQALAVSLVLLVAGIGMAVMGNVSVPFWLAANGLTLVSCAMLWAVVGLISFTFANAAAVPIISVSSFASSGLFLVVPALTVLSAPLAGRSMFNLSGLGTADLPPAYALALAAQCFLIGLLWLAIARRYHNADMPAFNLTLALLLIGLWSAVTVIGQTLPELFQTRVRDSDYGPRMVAGLASTAVVSLVAIGTIAQRMAGSIYDQPSGWFRLPTRCAIVICIFIATLPAYLGELTLDVPDVIRPLGATAVIAAMFIGIAFLLAWQYLAGKAGWAWLFLFIALPNAAPPIIDLALHAADTERSHLYSPLIAASPTGALIMLWEEQPARALPGIASQLALPLLPIGLYTARRRRQTAAAPPLPN